MNDWYETSRNAAVTRLVKAGIPLDGIYYWYPTPRGWEIMAWYLDDEPGEDDTDRQRRFNRLRHPNVWHLVLDLIEKKWGMDASLFRNDFDSFPRGRVYRNTIGRGYDEDLRIPNALRRVCEAFHRDPDKVKVVPDGHWDTNPDRLALIEKYLAEHDLSPSRPKVNPIVLVDPRLQINQNLTDAAAQKSPGIYDYMAANDLKVDRDLQFFVRTILPVKKLVLLEEPTEDEVAGYVLSEGDLPLVYEQNGKYIVKNSEARVVAAYRAGYENVKVWLYGGYFK